MDNLVVDSDGVPVVDPDDAVVGRHFPGVCMVWALPLLGGGLSRRYSTAAPGGSALYGLDMSFVLPPAVAISSATVDVLVNTFKPSVASTDWTVGPVTIDGSIVYARLSGGQEGVDYQVLWAVSDVDGNVWPRTALLLCSQTS